MTLDSIDVTDRVDEDSAHLVGKLLLAAGSVAFLAYLLTLLPGVDRIVPRTPVTLAAVLGAIATAVIVVLLLYAAPRIGLLTEVRLDAPRPVAEQIGAVVTWTVVLAAILVAHRGFAGLAVPLLSGEVWLYDVAFLLIALPVVVFLAVHCYRGLEPGAALFATRFADDGTADGPAERGDGGSGGRSGDRYTTSHPDSSLPE